MKKNKEVCESELNRHQFGHVPRDALYPNLFNAFCSYFKEGSQGRTEGTAKPRFLNVVASLLPYCDAIFVDNQIRAFLAENPVADRLAKYRTKIFSSRTIVVLNWSEELKRLVPTN